MQFEIIIHEKALRYEMISVPLSTILLKQQELLDGKIRQTDWIDWQLRNFIKPMEGNGVVMNLQLFDDKEYTPYYESIMGVIEEFTNKEKKEVRIIPKGS